MNDYRNTTVTHSLTTNRIVSFPFFLYECLIHFLFRPRKIGHWNSLSHLILPAFQSNYTIHIHYVTYVLLYFFILFYFCFDHNLNTKTLYARTTTDSILFYLLTIIVYSYPERKYSLNVPNNFNDAQSDRISSIPHSLMLFR